MLISPLPHWSTLALGAAPLPSIDVVAMECPDRLGYLKLGRVASPDETG